MSDYLKFWQVVTPVFNHPPGDDLFIPQSQLRDVNRLKLFCEQGSSLMAVVAPPGHGKTTLARWLRQTLPPASHEVFVISLYQSATKAGWLMPKLATFLGTAPQIERIATGIDEIASEGRKLILIIDDADRLVTTEAFDEVTGLIAMQRAVKPCLSIVLLGAEGLDASISATAQLKNRLVLRAYMRPLTLEESLEYIAFRLKAAHLPTTVFSRDAAQLIASQAEGIYSLIDALCENGLIEAFLTGQSIVTNEIAARATAQLMVRGSPARREAPPPSYEMPLREAGGAGPPIPLGKLLPDERTLSHAQGQVPAPLIRAAAKPAAAPTATASASTPPALPSSGPAASNNDDKADRSEKKPISLSSLFSDDGDQQF